MKQISVKSMLGLSLFIALFSFNACQKESFQVADAPNKAIIATDRGPGGNLMYGVTVFSQGNPSQLVELDLATGQVTNTLGVFMLNSNNAAVPIEDLKGICCVNGQIFATTGPNDVDMYSNMLIKINPQTGQASIISYAPTTISDIDYNPATQTIYGLQDNANRLYSITDNNNNWGTYNLVGNIGNMGSNSAKGLSVAPDVNGLQLVVVGTEAFGGDAVLYNVPFGGGAATPLTVLQPADELAAGHTGIGYDRGTNTMFVNRNGLSAGFGLNSFGWQAPFGANTNTGIWGTSTDNFEDLTTTL